MADWNWGSSVDTVVMTVCPMMHRYAATLMRPRGNDIATVYSTAVSVEGGPSRLGRGWMAGMRLPLAMPWGRRSR